jgi:glutathione synthase/RimK-type ligase-like ATP-grasp enzyme
MRICVIHPKICTESAQELAQALGADRVNPFETDRRDFRAYDLVFNYGCHRDIYAKKVINSSKAVGICKNKVETFKILHANKLPAVGYATTKAMILPHWEWIVVRDKVDGARAEGLTYVENGKDIPNGALYTEFFEHKYEYRVGVLNGKVVGRYRKDVVGVDWEFTRMLKGGFGKMDEACSKAAAAIGIDYVGFDVLENKKGEFVILEANSGPIITEETIKAVKKYIKQI